MWSHLRKQINPFICVASFPQLTTTVVVSPEEAPALAHTDFLLSFRIPVVMLLDACQWLMIKYSYLIVTEFGVLTNGVDEDVQNLPMAPASTDDSWRSN